MFLETETVNGLKPRINIRLAQLIEPAFFVAVSKQIRARYQFGPFMQPLIGENLIALEI